MKQFDLKEYLKDPNKKVVTRDGRNVRIICTDHDNIIYPVVGEIKGYDFPFYFSENGYSMDKDENDLFFGFEKHEGWALFVKNRYSSNLDMLGPIIYNTREIAQREREAHPYRYGAIVKVEWEE